jgi:hypothetical protein
MAKVYGYSVDIVCIEHIEGGCTEIDCFDKDVRIKFEDGTVIRVGYPKDGMAVWWIEIEEEGSAYSEVEICEDEDTNPYSDVFVIDAEAEIFSVIGQKYRRS